ncbi:YaaR family protein [Treponema phagedenis]|uniref:DUF327 family protein n=4 Tax=Treponema phagedenis TaxID=162 RepID=A0AAE6M9I2_TREPH|nr:DUF327 family protein [Treponema phagedenis]NVP24137.1 DUF327 family protein [Treponema phagedenis]QEJ96290.1 DUF327 family protein [Treponema phagedenis]QEJ99302.1 DUF327 family protein [Treponema phagedenis]QEK00067.1 DUF327 family protein [Treponema phagedenis]QEK04873.1 DUF327 family protein [Treponema phagedenis]
MANRIDNSNYTSSLSAHFLTADDIKQKKNENKKTETKQKLSFFHLLTDNQAKETIVNPQDVLKDKTYEEAIIFFQDQVHSAGDALKEYLTFETIAAYKKAVQSFAQFVIKNNYTAETKTIIKMNKKTGMPDTIPFTKIKVIDEKLDSFIAELLTNQADQLRILQKTEEIYGLLIDLIS